MSSLLDNSINASSVPDSANPTKKDNVQDPSLVRPETIKISEFLHTLPKSEPDVIKDNNLIAQDSQMPEKTENEKTAKPFTEPHISRRSLRAAMHPGKFVAMLILY